MQPFLPSNNPLEPIRRHSPIKESSTENANRIFQELVCQHGHRLHRFVTRRIGNEAEAADIAQQAFIEASCAYAGFRGDSKLSTWLYGIALNLIRNYLSRAPEQRYNFVQEEALLDHVSIHPTPQQAMEEQEVIRILSVAMEHLPYTMREILHLAGVENLSYEEISRTLGVPMGTVRSRLSRARTALREKMEELGVVDMF